MNDPMNNHSVNDCIFCKIVDKQVSADVVHEDEKVICFKDIRPKANVHLLVVSKKHIKSLNETDDTHKDLLGHMMLTLPKLAKSHGLSTGFRTVINTGVGGGQEIDHIHFHLLGNGIPKF